MNQSYVASLAIELTPSTDFCPSLRRQREHQNRSVLGESHEADQCVAADGDFQEVELVAVVPLVVAVGSPATVEDVVEVAASVVAGVPLAVVAASEVVREVRGFSLNADTVHDGRESMASMARGQLKVDWLWIKASQIQREKDRDMWYLLAFHLGVYRMRHRSLGTCITCALHRKPASMEERWCENC